MKFAEEPETYKDVLGLPHHRSTRRVPLSRQDRAAQFSPFAALSGHSEALAECARSTDGCPPLAEDQQELLDWQLRALARQIQRKPLVKLCFFEPDSRKSGGQFCWLRGRLLAVDRRRGFLVLDDGRQLPFCKLRELESLDGEGELPE